MTSPRPARELLIRELALKHQIDERTLKKALRGETIRVHHSAARAKLAVEEYRHRCPKPKEDPHE